MKKFLLSAALLAGLFANAQNIGFETSENYTAGQSVLGTNSWITFEDSIDITATLAVVTNSVFSSGTQSLWIGADGDVGTAAAPNPTPALLLPIEFDGVKSVSFDVYLDSAAIGGEYSDCTVSLLGPSTTGNGLGLGAGVNFDYEDYLLALGWSSTQNQMGYFYFGTEQDPLLFPRNTWFNMTIEVNDGAVEYFINGESLYQTILSPSVTTITHLMLENDNYGSAFAVDNIEISDVLDAPVFTADSFRVYPNPVNNQITVTLSQAQVLEGVKIYDMNGRMVKAFQATDMSNTFDVSDLTAGVYSIEVSSAAGTATKKLIKN